MCEVSGIAVPRRPRRPRPHSRWWRNAATRTHRRHCRPRPTGSDGRRWKTWASCLRSSPRRPPPGGVVVTHVCDPAALPLPSQLPPAVVERVVLVLAPCHCHCRLSSSCSTRVRPTREFQRTAAAAAAAAAAERHTRRREVKCACACTMRCACTCTFHTNNL